jgi:hypothetical protein
MEGSDSIYILNIHVYSTFLDEILCHTTTSGGTVILLAVDMIMGFSIRVLEMWKVAGR